MCIIFVSCHIMFGQQRVGEWKVFTDMKTIRNMIIVNNKIWTATGGGVFTYDTLTNKFEKFNSTNGLSANDAYSIIAEPAKRIWVGQSNGYVDVYEIEERKWKNINSNRPNSYTQSIIKDLYLFGDTLYIAAEFGVFPFKINKWEFGDTYASFPQLQSFSVSCLAVTNDFIFIGTNKGLTFAPRKAPNLSSPDPWITLTTIPGLSTSNVTDIEIFNDTAIIATSNGAAYYDGNTLRTLNLSIGKSIQKLYTNENKLYLLIKTSNGFRIETYSTVQGEPEIFLSNESISANTMIVSSSIWIGTSDQGLLKIGGTDSAFYYPNGPNSNLFCNIAVDEKGILWAASGSTSAYGFYRFNPSLPEDEQWKTFPGNCYYRISLGKGTVWVSSWGNGIVKVANDTIQKVLNYYTKPSLPGARNDISSYVVAGNAAEDRAGKTWIVNRVEDRGRSLLRLDTDTSATFFDNQYNINAGFFHTMVIDKYNTKWIAGDLPWEIRSKGLYLFNESPILQEIELRGNSTTGFWGFLSTSNGLKSDAVICLAIDLEGALWIGTNKGISIINDPLYPRQLTPCYAIEPYDLFVQSIAVDGNNNKWLGTKEGVFVLNSDGTQLLKHYNVYSTGGMLLDNDVISIAIDQTRGIAYFATNKGLSSLGIESIQPKEKYTTLEISPNPYLIPNDQPLTIRNLVANSGIKILSINNRVIRQFNAQGAGRAFWDGKDYNGQLVSSGIYFIVAFSENGEQTVVGKVAIVRR